VGGKGLVLWAGRGLSRKQEGEEEWVVLRRRGYYRKQEGREHGN
jgi:hypothetical protein